MQTYNNQMLFLCFVCGFGIFAVGCDANRAIIEKEITEEVLVFVAPLIVGAVRQENSTTMDDLTIMVVPHHSSEVGAYFGAVDAHGIFSIPIEKSGVYSVYVGGMTDTLHSVAEPKEVVVTQEITWAGVFDLSSYVIGEWSNNTHDDTTRDQVWNYVVITQQFWAGCETVCKEDTIMFCCDPLDSHGFLYGNCVPVYWCTTW